MRAERLLRLRGAFEAAVYLKVAKPYFFTHDPETIHDRVSKMGTLLGRSPITRGVTRLLFDYRHPMLESEALGIRFRNPIGLAAGFDKNARETGIMPSVGFGFMEVGSITARPCQGNPKPRLFRLPESASLIVNYGLANQGVEATAAFLERHPCAIPLGTNIAPTNDSRTAKPKDAIAEYAESYRRLALIGEYSVLNLSCPNTCNDQPFADPDRLRELLAEIATIPSDKPLFLKLSPDMDFAGYDALLAVAERGGVDGLICTNLNKHWDKNPDVLDSVRPKGGGLGGKALAPLSDRILKYVATQSAGKFTLVGLGGVASAEDAYRKIGLGASLVQLVTGMIYQGPQLIGQINQGLVELLRRDGFKSVSEAVGKDL